MCITAASFNSCGNRSGAVRGGGSGIRATPAARAACKLGHGQRGKIGTHLAALMVELLIRPLYLILQPR